MEWTSYSTVPNVFIGRKHIDGSDAVMEKHHAGKLMQLVRKIGSALKI
ncbi:putative glutaredoxin, Thioredoxin-like superfamily [Helianthus anomalus]